MEAKCRERIGSHEAARLTICFLDRNLETLLEVLEGTAVVKDVVDRDRILQRAASAPTLIRRGSEAMPTWAHLVETVARRIGP